MTFDDAISEYFDATPSRNKERDAYSLKRLRPHFRGRPLDSIRRADVQRYVSGRLRDGVKPATVNRELDLVSAAWNHVCFIHELQLPNPVSRMSLEEPEGRVRWLTREEADRLLAACDRSRSAHLGWFVRLALHTGCRRSELLKLEWARVDLERGYLRLEAKHTKSRRRRVVPLNDVAKEALGELRAFAEAYCAGSPWVFSHANGRRITTLRKSFMAALEVAGIEDFRIHDLRHTFASWLVMRGVSLYVVRDLLGHSSIEQTERYAHLAPEHLGGAVQQLLAFA